MSFEPIVFQRTIPPTVPTASPISTAATATSTAPSLAGTPSGSGSTTANVSVASQLASQLGNLVDTAKYLQSVILSMNSGLGVSIDASSDPDTATALSQIYNGQVPPAVSLTMLSNMLDAELGGNQVNLAAGTSSSVVANPFMQQALMTATRAVEAQLATSGNVNAVSALMLRRLKSDVITNSTMQAQLMQYPAAQNLPAPSASTPTSLNVVPAATIDISPIVSGLVQSYINQSGQNYSATFQVLTQPDGVASDVTSVVSALATCAVPDLIRMNATLQMSSDASLTQSTQDLSTGLSAFVFPQAVSQSSGMMFQLDQVMQMAITPMKTMPNAPGTAFSLLSQAMTPNGTLQGVVRSMIQPSDVQQSGPLAGMPLNSFALSGLANGSPTPPAIASLSFTAGINEISSLLSFSLSITMSSSAVQQDSFQRLTVRVSGDTGNLVKVMAVMSSVASLVSLTTAFIKAQQNGPAVATLNPATQLATIGNILASSETGNGASYTVQNGLVTVAPPTVPAPTAGATVVFAQSGISTSLTGLTQPLAASVA